MLLYERVPLLLITRIIKWSDSLAFHLGDENGMPETSVVRSCSFQLPINRSHIEEFYHIAHGVV
jgi:hypothetical protein